MSSHDMRRMRKERLRWLILESLNGARPIGTSETILLAMIQTEIPDLDKKELRLELDYLAERKLIKLERDKGRAWFADLNRYGIDIVEYTLPCEPGISRPDQED